MNVQAQKDGDQYTVTMKLSESEYQALMAAMPEPPQEPPTGMIQPMSWFHGSHYCVQVRTGGRDLCKKTIYENSAWAHARALGIMQRCGGSSMSMSSGKCDPENTCGF